MFKLTLNPNELPHTGDWDSLERWRRTMERAVNETMRELLSTATFGMSHPEILEEGETIDPDDFELIALRQDLHEAAKVADAALKAMPDHSSIAEEEAAIEAILKAGEEIAAKMFSMKPNTLGGIDAKARAGNWLAGNYIGTYLKESA